MKKLEIGNILKAKDECIINSTKTLTVGGEYKILDFFINNFVIQDDDEQIHYFSIREDNESYYENFFELVSN